MAAHVPHKCGPCILCKLKSTGYTHPPKMLVPVYALICSQAEGGEQPLGADDSCMWHACYKQAAMNVGNENFKSRWRAAVVWMVVIKMHTGKTQMASPVAVGMIIASMWPLHTRPLHWTMYKSRILYMLPVHVPPAVQNGVSSIPGIVLIHNL